MTGNEPEKISIECENVVSDIAEEPPEFPKYSTQLMNLANQNAQGTRPKVVGQLSELIQECPDQSYSGWENWYLEKHPDAIDDAVDMIWPMIQNFKNVLEDIDKAMVRNWVEDLVLTKTAEGLIIQEAVLSEVGNRRNKEWELAGPEDESKNIDGYIGDEPVSIKPESYKSKDPTVRDDIKAEIIYYRLCRNPLRDTI